MPRLDPRLKELHESATVALADRVRRLRAEGRAVVPLQTGDPDFATPPEIVEAAHRALRDGATHYGESRGVPALRAAIADSLAEAHQVSFDPESELLVTHGAVHGYHCALAAIVSPGDEVLVPDPAWMPHANAVRLAGGTAVRVPSSTEAGFWPDLEAWDAARSARTVALLVNSPNNPTGRVAPRQYLEALVQFASRHDLHVISDEVYDHLLFEGRRHTCLASLDGARERTWLLGSFSKTYAMTGWRLGWLAAPPDFVTAALKVSQHTTTNLAPFVQHAGVVALRDASVQAQARRMVETYARRRERVLEIAGAKGDSPFRFDPPEGAFYFFVDARAIPLASAEIAERLLTEAGVAVAPGSVYGACGEGFLRVTIAAGDEDVEAGIEAMLAWADREGW